jgi:hypothetical protein
MKKLLILLIFCFVQLEAGNWTLPAKDAPNVPGFSGLVYTHTFDGGADTAYCPFNEVKKGDSTFVSIVAYKMVDSIYNMSLRLLQSSNNTSWRVTNLFTDSTTWALANTNISAATAKVQDFSLTPVANPYRLYPYNKLMLVTGATSDTGAVVKVYIYQHIK